MDLYSGNPTAQPTGMGGSIFADRATGVRVKLEDFLAILSKVEEPLVIITSVGLFTKIYKYVTAYKGFIFFTESLDKLEFNTKTEIIYAQNFWSEI
jgi:hypothetical protein